MYFFDMGTGTTTGSFTSVYVQWIADNASAVPFKQKKRRT